MNYTDTAQDSAKVCRGYFLAEEKMLGLKYINLLFAMRWLNAKDIGQVDEIIEGLKFLEFDTAQLTEALGPEKYKAKLSAVKAQSAEDGVIGVPFLAFRDEGFLGAERIDYLEDRAEKRSVTDNPS